VGPLNRRGVRDRIGGRNWSDFAGEGHKAPITAAPSLDDWHTAGGVPGIYAVASKGLARGYTDEQLVASGPFDLSSACEPGARTDFERGPYAGRMQAWHNCEVGTAATFLTLSAAPEGRECAVLMQLAMYDDEADVEVGQHILDAFEARCDAAATYPLAAAADEQQYAPKQQCAEGAQTAPTLQYGAEEEVECSDFVTMYGEPSQWQAQQFYDELATPEQRAVLDPDGDGFACSEGSFSEPEMPEPDNPAYPSAEGCANPGPCGANPVEDPGDNVDPETGLVVGDDTPECATPEQVLASGLCKKVIVGAGS
jgi:hypothetical protein